MGAITDRRVTRLDPPWTLRHANSAGKLPFTLGPLRRVLSAAWPSVLPLTGPRLLSHSLCEL